MLEFRILGPLEIRVEEERLKLSGSKRQIVLSALLLADGTPVSLDRLIDAVWGQHAPATAAKQIRNATSDLRRIHPELGRMLARVGDGYQLHADEGQLDSRRFIRQAAKARQLLQEGDSAEALGEFRSALSLWRGPALTGLGAPALQAQVARLGELRLAVMEECVQLELAHGLHQSVVGELSVWVAEHPLRERLVAQLMLALYRSGAQARALNLYEQTRQTLRSELGVSPGPELQEIHRYILVNDQLSPGHDLSSSLWRNNLPAGTVHFAGRLREQRFLRESVRAHADRAAAPSGRAPSGKAPSGKTPSGPAASGPPASGPAASPAPAPPTAGAVSGIVAIDGMPGVGKTALAVHTAHQLTEAYPDAQLFVDMRAWTVDDRPLDSATALGVLLSGLGVTPGAIPAGLEERSAIWRRMLADRRVLILLDNVADTRQILPLLPGTPGCLTIVTSRYRLTDLMPTDHLTLQELSADEGRALFRTIAGDKRTLAEREAVDDVVDICGRLPLAIRLAATKLRHRPSWTVSYLASRLATGRQRLATLDTEDGGLTEAFRQSYQGLAPEQRRVFRLLGQLPGDLIDVGNVAGLAGLPAVHTDLLLESLVDAHLLHAMAPGRYRMHELLHAYAAELAGELGRLADGRLIGSASKPHALPLPLPLPTREPVLAQSSGDGFPESEPPRRQIPAVCSIP